MWEVLESAHRFKNRSSEGVWAATESTSQATTDICSAPGDLTIKLNIRLNMISGYVQKYSASILGFEYRWMDQAYMDATAELYNSRAAKYKKKWALELIDDLLKLTDPIAEKQKSWWDKEVESYILSNNAEIIKECMALTCELFYREVPIFSFGQKNWIGNK